MRLSILFFLSLMTIHQFSFAENCSRAMLEAFFEQKQFQNLNSCYQKMTSKDPSWNTLLLLQQKALYLQENWESFLGLSLFLRENHNIGAHLNKKTKDQIVSLEALGMMRLCRYEEAKVLIDRYSHELTDLPKNKISEVKLLLTLHDLPESLRLNSSHSHVAPGVAQWPLSQQQFQRLSHPKNLKRKAQNLCETVISNRRSGV